MCDANVNLALTLHVVHLIVSLMMAQHRPEHVRYYTVNTKRQDQYIGCPKNIYTHNLR